MRFKCVLLCLYWFIVAECIGYYYYYPPVFWHWQNCVFRKLRESYGTNATKEYFMKVLPHNKVRIVCPSDITVNDWRDGQGAFLKYENFYLVDKNGYDNCKVNDDVNPTMNKRLLLCNRPQTVKFLELQFHPKYNREEPKFIPGQHYYFIGTGGRQKDVYRKSGGNCEKNHMKLHIYVCDPKKEQCLWEQPYCEPTYEFNRVMTAYSRSLPPPTRAPVTLPPPPTNMEPVTTLDSTPHPITDKFDGMMQEQKDDGCDNEDSEASVHMILNFVLGAVILFMAVVIVILACGLARKSKAARPVSRAFSAISAQEPNSNLYQESARFIQPTYATPTTKSPPQTPISLNPPFYLAPMAEIRPRSASTKNGFNNVTYGRTQDSRQNSTIQGEAAPMLPDSYPNAPEPV